MMHDLRPSVILKRVMQTDFGKLILEFLQQYDVAYYEKHLQMAQANAKDFGIEER